MDPFFNNVDLASKVLSAQVAAHEVYSSNLANASTPNYQSKIPSFEVKLDQAKLRAQQQEDFQPNLQADSMLGGGSILKNEESPWEITSKTKVSKAPANSAGNNVKIDQEMASMSENSILYMSTLKVLSKQIALTKYAITAGGR